MWDPRNYTDSDFGLGEDEIFEPDDVEDERIDVEIDPHVMTVLGPVRPEDLGMTQVGEFVLTANAASESDLQLDEVAKAIEELTSFVTVGGKSIVDMTTSEQGRDLLGLFDLARRVPAHLICSVGAAIGADCILEEVRQGVGPRTIRPGVIQVHEWEDALQSAIEVADSTGLPIYIHGSMASIASQLGAAQSRDSHRTNLVAIVPCEDIGSSLIMKLLETGIFVMATGVGQNVSQDQNLARLLVELESEGYGQRLLISQAIRRRSQLLAWGGGPGLIHLLERFTLDLMEVGAGAPFVRQLLVDNPARALTIVPPGETVPT